MSRASVLTALLISCIVVAPRLAQGQAVLSARSGVVHFFEGAVSVDGKPLEPKLGRFTTLADESDLRTALGRAEVLLTPGVILRLGEQSAIRMVSSALADTRVELLDGSAIIDASDTAPGTSVTIQYAGWSVQLANKGSYRIDSDPPRVRVRDGQLAVWSDSNIEPIAVGKGTELALADNPSPEKANGESHDSLSDWSDGRDQSISADNAIAANIQDPGSMSFPGLPPDGFTYFPMLGLYPASSAVYSSSGLYQPGIGSAVPPYQPGFYSIYLPGYTRRPAMLGLPIPINGLQRSPYSPIRIGAPGSILPRPIGVTPRPITPPVTIPRPVAPAPRGGIRH